MFTIQSLHVAMEIWGAIFCALAAFCMFYNVGMKPGMRKVFMYMELASALLMSMDALAWWYRGYPGNVGYWMVRISNFMVFFISDVILLLVHIYVCMNIFGERGKNNKIKSGFEYYTSKECPLRVKIVFIISVIGMVLVIMSQFTGLYYTFDDSNTYHRSQFHFVSIIVGMAAMAIDMSLLVQYRKKLKKQIFISIMMYFILPFMAAIALIFIYGISLLNIAITISMICMFVVAIVEQGKELNDARIEVMLSQIQPHFIYNTLTSIKSLCRHDPDEAVDTINEFTLFLRGNINSLTEKDTIPVKKELEHVKHYLAIEKKRFGDRINVEYNIDENDFKIPPLTLQPIVENAVKHGIGKKEDGGTIVISTGKDESGYFIKVSDDGVGFDMENFRIMDEDGTKHVGIINVKKRIEQKCNGTFNIDSCAGKGTVVEIHVS